MTGRYFLCTLAVCLFFAAIAPAQTSLVWKFEKGQVYEAERSATHKQTVTLNGKQFKQQRGSTWHVRLVVKDKQAENYVVLATLTKVEHQLTGGSDAEMIDPKLPEKMQGSTFTLDVTPSGKIAKLQGYDEFLKRLAGEDTGRLKALRITFPESTLKETFADLFGPLPSKSDNWKREYVEPIPHFGALRSTASYTQNRDKITYTIQTKYEAPAKDDKMLLFRIVKGSIDSDQAKGSIVFDSAKGHLVEHERTMMLRGTLTIEKMERQQPLEFSSENVVKIRVRKAK
jgi:hypothetical protein